MTMPDASGNPRIVVETFGTSMAAPEPKTAARRGMPAGSPLTPA